MTIIFEAWDEVDMRMRDTDAAGIGNDPLCIEYLFECSGDTANFHKHKAEIGFIHIPDPPVVFLWDELRVSWIEWIFIQERHEFGVLIKNVV